jgi:hypothetical protein
MSRTKADNRMIFRINQAAVLDGQHGGAVHLNPNG